MNYPTEAERLQVFRNLYGEQNDVLNPQAGVAKAGFSLGFLDDKTLYAQFRDRAGLPFHHEIVEFARGGPSVGIVRRRRVYSGEPKLALHSAELKYRLPSFREARWSFYRNGNGAIVVPPTLELHSASTYPYNEDITLGDCRYKQVADQLIPARIYIPLGNMDDVRRIHQSLPQALKHKVPDTISLSISEAPWQNFSYTVSSHNPISLQPVSGEVAPGKDFTHPDLPVKLTVEATTNRVKVTRENEAKNHTLVLEAPVVNSSIWYRKTVGNWQDYLRLLEQFPTNFRFE